MRTRITLLLAFLLGTASTAALAAECTSSFYCYGNTANAVVRVAPRPPPIPPPNPRVVQQRRQAQLALRNTRPTPRATVRATPTPQRVVTAPARPAPRANVRPPAAQPTRTAQPSRNVASCQSRNDRAGYLESQAVMASKRGDRNASVSLFRDAANTRKQACR